MTPTTLFSRDELAAAFALLLPAARADELATRWFEQFADEIDDRGRYVHGESWGSSYVRWPTAAEDTPEWNGTRDY